MNENRLLVSPSKPGGGLYRFSLAGSALILPDGLRGFFRRRNGLIMVSALIVVALGVIGLNALPAAYRATTTIALKPAPQRDNQPGYPTLEQRMQLEIQALHSRELATRVIGQLKLDANPEFNPTLRGEGLLGTLATMVSELGRVFRSKPVPSPAETEALRRSAIIDTFISRLTVTPLRMTGLIQVTVTSEDARTSYTVANAIADTYIKSATAARAEILRKTATALEERIGSIREELRDTPARAGGLAAMERQLEARRTLLQSYITRLGEILLEQNSLESHAVVQAAAVLPLRAAGVPLSRVLPLLIFAGLVFGVALALWRELSDKTVISASQIEPLFGLRVLADDGLSATSRHAAHSLAERVGLELILAEQPSRHMVVAFVCTQIDNRSKSLAADTARIVAMSGRRTLLVDASRIERRSNGGGPLAKQVRRDTSDQSPIRHDEASSLDVLAADLADHSLPAACEKLGRIIAALGDAYEFVVLELAADGNGAAFRYLATRLDSAIVLIRERRTRRAEVRALLDELLIKDVHTLGAVFMESRPPAKQGPRAVATAPVSA